MKLLIVEDDKLQAQELYYKLIDIGYSEILMAHDSTIAIKIFNEEKPDLGIIDICLKNSQQNGIGLVQEMKKIRATPIIFLSSFSDQETVSKARSIGYSHYLLKPVYTRQLEIAIQDALTSGAKILGGDLDTSITPIIRPLTQELQSFFVKGIGKSYEKVNIADILWITTNSPVLEIRTLHKKHYSSCQLGTFLKQIHHPKLVRIHASHLVNIDHVSKINGRNVFIVYQGEEIDFPISKSYENIIQKQFVYLRSKVN